MPEGLGPGPADMGLGPKEMSTAEPEQERTRREVEIMHQRCRDRGEDNYRDVVGLETLSYGAKKNTNQDYLLHGAIFFGEKAIQPDKSNPYWHYDHAKNWNMPGNRINNREDYLNHTEKDLQTLQEGVNNNPPTPQEGIDQLLSRDNKYFSRVDHKTHPVNRNNWMYHTGGFSFPGEGGGPRINSGREINQVHLDFYRGTLTGFAEAAQKAGDQKTYDRVQEILGKKPKSS